MKYLFLILFIGCAAVPQQLSPTVYYPKDVSVKVNGYSFEGTGVLPKASKYSLQIKAKGKVDLLDVATCHRDFYKEQAWGDDFFDSRYEAHFDYTPVAMEKENCAMQISAYEKVRGRHSWLYLDFEDDTYKLPAQVFCNGNITNSRGVSVCQSHSGLIQQISFVAPVDFIPDPKCPITTKDNKTFQIVLASGFCVYVFTDHEDKTPHRLTTYGFDQLLIRGE